MKKFLIVIIIILIILLVGQLAYYNIMNSNNEVQNSIVNEENTINQNNEQNVNINDNSIGTETSNEQRRNIISPRNISYIIERYSNEENLNRLLEEFYNFVNTDVNEIYNLINRMSINKILQLYDLNTEEINDMNIYSSEDFLNISIQLLKVTHISGVRNSKNVIDTDSYNEDEDGYTTFYVTFNYTNGEYIKLKVYLANSNSATPQIRFGADKEEE